MTTKNWLLITIVSIIAPAIHSQTTKPVLFKTAKELPPYLKLTKPVFDPGLNKNRVIKKPVVVPVVNRKNATDNLFIKMPSVFADGMNPEYAIPASRFVRNADGRIALLTTELFPQKQRVIYPLKISNVYSFSITTPMDISRFNNQVLHTSWKATVNNDGSFYLASNAFGGRLGVSGTEVSMMPETENSKTKFIAYQHGWCSNDPILLYNPASKTFLGKSISGSSVKFAAVKAADVLQFRSPSGIDINWDFTAFKTYSTDNKDHPSYFEFKRGTIDDRDGDGAVAKECGGNDCNDADGNVYPGAIEVCDNTGKDEDCDSRSYVQRDMDKDGFFDAACFNLDATGKIVSAGNDCDDNNSAIIPGAMKYISETQVEVCGVGICTIETNMKAVRQSNGTAIVMPR